MIYLAVGFEAVERMSLLQYMYLGRTNSHARRLFDHYGRVIDSTPAAQEPSMLYHLAKDCASFDILPAVQLERNGWLSVQALEEGILCLLFGTCQLFSNVLTARAEAGLLQIGNEVRGGNSNLAFDGPSKDRDTATVAEKSYLSYQTAQRLHIEATLHMQDLTINIAGEDFTHKDILDLVAAASIQQKTRNRAH